MSARPSRVFTAELMGTVASIHVHGAGAHASRVADAAADAVDRMRADERIFSSYRADSDISRLRSGVAALDEVDPCVREVWERCVHLREQTGGRFDAWWRGWFDPTGIVKGWSAERAARGALEGLVRASAPTRADAIDAVGLSVGGDLQVFTAAASDWSWRIGIADPGDGSRILATVEVRDGAVATSGTAERPGHLVDPRTGIPTAGVVGATVVADSLTDADVWATAAAVSGVRDLGWLGQAPAGTGLISDGTTVRRWINGVEVVDFRAEPALTR